MDGDVNLAAALRIFNFTKSSAADQGTIPRTTGSRCARSVMKVCTAVDVRLIQPTYAAVEKVTML
jgi:hypothetical protein